ncbi:MAG TPA: hypothetical protein H9910_07915 [Candidatus Mediterraneibacter quadrami]|uniref:Transposase (putative) YhgA-like domain-containing protein n=1 Tax=Candidatus Mediterraneibacter quadrami TaxID=2838684 RepID=A0A9D2U8R8_9FIRM|nr:hypothetical protein [Candidatus Mediterraneibacter quadrami]
MGSANVAVNSWLSDRERFADLFNGTLFDGKQLIHPEDLEDLDRETDILITGKSGKTRGLQRYRDIAKRWKGGSDLMVLACESQAKIHYAMPVRNMLYDSLTYTDQIRQLWGKSADRSGMTGEEYLSSFRKSDRIYPVITLVFYYDLKPWDGPTDLYGMFGLHENGVADNIIRKYVPNYHINLLDAGAVRNLKHFQTDLQQIFGVLKYRGNKTGLQNYMQENRDYFTRVNVDAYQALCAFLHSEKMLKEIKDSGKDVKIDMCQALEELYQDGVKEGREEGIAEGIAAVISNMLKSGMSITDIKKYTDADDRVIEQVQKDLK